MSRQTARTLTLVLGVLGMLFFLAMAFHMMERNTALFAGVACLLLAGLAAALGRGQE